MKHMTMAVQAVCTVALILGAAFNAAQAQLAPPPKLLPQVTLKRAPTPLQTPLPMAAPTTAQPQTATPRWCEEDCLLGPTKPMRFELQAGERESGGFAVTAPGPIKIQVQASGVPLVLSLRRPDGRIVERQGSGNIVIDDAASAADIAKGVLWGVGLRAAQEAPVGTAAPGMHTMPRAVAGGTLSVQHPPTDAAQVQAAMKRSTAETQQKAASLQAPAVPMADAQALAQMAQKAQAAHDKQVAQKHAAALNSLRAKLSPEVHAQINQRIGLRLQGQTVQQASTAAPVQMVKSDAMSKQGTLAAPLAQPLAQPITQTRPGLLKAPAASDSNKAAATGAAAVGTGGGAATVAPTTPPTLASASTSEGDPGTPVTLSGSEFGNAQGAVQFIVGNGRDVAAQITYWSATQIVTEVPYADGIPVYDGQVYVKRSDGVKTALRPFRFLPLYDVTEIGLPNKDAGDYQLVASANSYPLGTDHVHHMGAAFWGFAGNDKFYERAQLRNGWAVVGARLSGRWDTGQAATGGAYLVDSRPGSASPFVNVRWWVNGGLGFVNYTIRVDVKSPKNLPCSANPCPVL